MAPHTDVIDSSRLNNLAELLQERAHRTPDGIARTQYDPRTKQWNNFTWNEDLHDYSRWQSALRQIKLEPGSRVAVMAPNCREWALFDFAALGLGLVVVPLFYNDRADNVSYILAETDTQLLLIGNGAQWTELQKIDAQLSQLHVISIERIETGNSTTKIKALNDWLGEEDDLGAQFLSPPENGLASIVYTSGTTGRAKGAMLTHRNILINVERALKTLNIFTEDRLLSFLPLSHMFERTVGHYIPVTTGSNIIYARSVTQLTEDLVQQRPTIIVTVPLIFERTNTKLQKKLEAEKPFKRKLFGYAVEVGWQKFLHQQGREHMPFWANLAHPLLDHFVSQKVRQHFGGQLRFAVSGGAALSSKVSQLFIGLGIPILQGYGLTETSPSITVNRLEDNIPDSVGKPLPGLEVRIGENDEIQTRSPCVMAGYWKNQEATDAMIDQDGWLHTGDQGRFDAQGHLFITGRIKEILVLSNGEKVSPTDIELELTGSHIIEQAMLIGDARPYLTALIVPNKEKLHQTLATAGIDPDDHLAVEHLVLERVQHRLQSFPGYAKIHHIAVLEKPWSIESGALTPTLKLKRSVIMEQYSELIDSLYDDRL